MVADRYLTDDLLFEPEIEALKYTIDGLDEKNFLAGRVTHTPVMCNTMPSNARVQKRVQSFLQRF